MDRKPFSIDWIQFAPFVFNLMNLFLKKVL